MTEVRVPDAHKVQLVVQGYAEEAVLPSAGEMAAAAGVSGTSARSILRAMECVEGRPGRGNGWMKSFNCLYQEPLRQVVPEKARGCHYAGSGTDGCISLILRAGLRKKLGV